jgi:heparanase 1
MRAFLLYCCCILVFFQAAFGAKGPTTNKTVRVSVDVNRIGGELAPQYGSFNFDWWPNSAGPEWDDAGLLNIDLGNPHLRYLAKELFPAHLRIGGTLGDTIVYTIPGKSHRPCTEGRNCLNMTRWEQLVDFARKTGVTLAFGLNERYGAGVPGSWDPSNARDFLLYIRDHRQEDVIFGFELGNELDLAHYNGSVCAQDFRTLHNILVEVWPDPARRPKLIGPDIAFSVPFLLEFLKGASDVIDVVTWHLYIGYGLDPKLPEELIDPKFLNRTRHSAEPIVAARDKYAPHAALWCGETAAAYHSGRNGTTNAFESGFWYLNQLGRLALMNHTVQCRQTLVGGNYGLLQKKTFEPNPDYWTLLLLKRAIGRRAFYATSTDIYVPTYAYCSRQYKGGIVMTFINLAKEDTYQVDLSGGIERHVPRIEYHLSAPQLDSRVIYLNGVALKLKDSGLLPSLAGNVINNEKAILTLQPLTYTVVEFPRANVRHC